MTARSISYTHEIALKHSDRHGIGIDVKLIGEKNCSLVAKLDTGATYCLFDPQYADRLGITVEDGEEQTFSTATGTFRAYLHHLTFRVQNLEFSSFACFYSQMDAGRARNVLGLNGFINKISLGVEYADNKLFLSQRSSG